MIDRNHELPLKPQCQILRLARSTAYYQPEPVSAENLALMHRIDELHLKFPFAGARMLSHLSYGLDEVVRNLILAAMAANFYTYCCLIRLIILLRHYVLQNPHKLEYLHYVAIHIKSGMKSKSINLNWQY